jgi:DNA-damage-inducible protein J
MSALTAEQLNAELEKGFADVTAGRTKPAGAVFDKIRKDYGV